VPSVISNCSAETLGSEMLQRVFKEPEWGDRGRDKSGCRRKLRNEDLYTVTYEMELFDSRRYQMIRDYLAQLFAFVSVMVCRCLCSPKARRIALRLPFSFLRILLDEPCGTFGSLQNSN